jgi:Predicted glycosyltransferases
MNERIFAIVVTFHPCEAHLRELLDALLPQVEQIILVDNTPGSDDVVGRLVARMPGLENRIRLLALGGNQGVAAALNIGMRAGFAAGCTHVLLSDQDSVPAANMVSCLLDADRSLRRQGAAIAAVGPAVRNQTVGQAFRFVARRRWLPWYVYDVPSSSRPLIQVVSLITSGSLLSRAAVESVGPMREDLFVDYVDIEWCQRAYAKGLPSYACASAKLTQRMGDRTLQIWLLGWRRVSEYSPLRLYYQFRNSAYLCRMDCVESAFALGQPWFWLGKIYAYLLFSRQKRLHSG